MDLLVNLHGDENSERWSRKKYLDFTQIYYTRTYIYGVLEVFIIKMI